MANRSTVALALTATALGASGCGSSTAKPLTRAELTAKADAICNTVTAKLKKTKAVSTEQDIAQVAPELVSFEQSALTELSKLVPPAALESDWKQFLSGAQTLAENTAKLGESAKAKNLKTARGAIVESEAIQKHMQAIAKRDELTACEQVA